MALPLSAEMLDELRRFLEQGVSLIAVSSDASRVPSITRCAAARLDDAGQVRVLISMPEGAAVVANIENSRRLALSCARPSTYRTFQLKGADARRTEWPEGEAAARAHLAAFSSEVEPLGLTAAACARLWSSHFVAIAFTPSEIFDQSPGPSAGAAVLP